MSKKNEDQQEMQEFLELLKPLDKMERALVKNSISTISSLRAMESHQPKARKPNPRSAATTR